MEFRPEDGVKEDICQHNSLDHTTSLHVHVHVVSFQFGVKGSIVHFIPFFLFSQFMLVMVYCKKLRS